MRAESLLTRLDMLLALRPTAKAAMFVAARRQPGWKVLYSLSFFGPVRAAQLLAIVRKPYPHEAEPVAVRCPGGRPQSSADQKFRKGKLE